MIVLFYSNQCNSCQKLMDYLTNNNILDFFKLINVDNLQSIPENITVVPTIIDTTIESAFEGKKAFEFIMNQKYFNRPTNNVDYWINGLPKPTIEEDKKAIEKHNFNFACLDDEPKQPDIKQIEKKPLILLKQKKDLLKKLR